MRILFFYNESYIEGKGNIDLFSTCKELKKNGDDVFLIVRKDNEVVHENNIFPILPSPMKAFFLLPILFLKTLMIIRKIKPDIIFSEGGWYIPLIIDLIHKIKKIPIVYVFRGLVLETLVSFHAKSFIVKNIAKFFIKINNLIFNNSENLIAITNSLKKYYQFKIKKDIKVIDMHHIDLKYYSPISSDEIINIKKTFSIDNSKIIIMYSGAIEEWHIPYLMNLVEVISNLNKEGLKNQLVIMGWGTQKNQFMENKIIKKKIEQKIIKILPWVEHEIVPKIIASADICIDPYLRKFPTNFSPAGKLLEYMACQKCIIATKGYSNEEIIKNEENGFIIDGTKKELYQCLKKILVNQELILNLGKKARESLILKQEKDESVKKLQTFLKSIKNNN